MGRGPPGSGTASTPARSSWTPRRPAGSHRPDRNISERSRAYNQGMSSPARVLVVDDEEMVRDGLARYLERDGFAVETASDGAAVLEAVDRGSPDVVLLDLMLPRVDGFEVFRRLQASSPPAVIMLTARGDETDRVIGLELGADDYVTKPFSPREVVARVK